jgi:predicted RNA-binding protein with RPS1 domain
MVTGKVTRLVSSCAFVELEEGIEAIIPISEMSDQRIKSPSEVLSEGQEVEARVKQVEPNKRRISLSLKAAVQEKERRETRSTLREINERGGDDEVRLGDVFGFGQALRAAKERGKEKERERSSNRAAARERALQAAAEEEEDWDDTEDVVEEVSDATEEATVAEETTEADKDINSDSLPGALQEDTESDNLPDASDTGTPVGDDIAGDDANSGQSSPA